MSGKVKLSHLVGIHQNAIPVIEKAMLDVIWDDEDELLLQKVAEEISLLGKDPDVDIERDAPLGLGDTDALIRFCLSLYQLQEGNNNIDLENYRRLLRPISPPVFDEVFDEIFNEESGE